MVLKLRHQQTRVHPRQAQPSSIGGEISQKNAARYRETISVAVWVLVALVACYLPYGLVLAVITINGSSSLLYVVWTLATTLVYLNSSLNPILYCWKIVEVRQEVKNTIRQILCLSN